MGSMKPDSIRKHLAPYGISAKRETTIRHAFASAIAPLELYDEARVREALIGLGQRDLDNLVCTYCDRPATSWDHLEALVAKKKASGFGHTLGNLVPACEQHNSKRGNRRWDVWAAERGVPEERIDAIRTHQARYSTSATSLALTPAQAQRLEAIQQQILYLMKEADMVVAAARKAGS